MNGYELTRDWFDFRFENPDKCKPIHTELYIYLVDQWNRLGQVNKFGLPTQYTMQVLNINSYNTFKSALDSLIEFGFIKVVSESKNQHQSRVIALSNNDKANSKALNKANANALYKALYEATDTIIEQKNKRTKEKDEREKKEILFEKFWNLYNKKVERKSCLAKFIKLDFETIDKIINAVPKYVMLSTDIKYRKNPETWLNGECWNDEIPSDTTITNNNTTKWTHPSEIDFNCNDWRDRLPKHPPKGTDEFEVFKSIWKVSELRQAEIKRNGYSEAL